MKTKEFSSPDIQEIESVQAFNQVSEQSSNQSAENSWFNIVYCSAWALSVLWHSFLEVCI